MRSHTVPPRRLRIGLAIHALAYVIVTVVLAVIDLGSPGNTWFYWPLLGWGLGLAWHTAIVVRHVGLRPRPHESHQA